MLAHPRVAQDAKAALEAQFRTLDPVALLHDIRRAQARLVTLADAAPNPENDFGAKADVEQFLEGLRHAWKEGGVRPTSRKKPPAPRGRRRPDPIASVTADLRRWFNEDRSQTARELLGRLQAAYPAEYPDGLLRTVQRRLKVWRAEIAKDLVFGKTESARPPIVPDALCNMAASRVGDDLDQSALPVQNMKISQEHSTEATM